MISKFKTFLKNNIIEKLQYLKYKYIYNMNIHPSVIVSLKANLDTTNPKGIYISEYTMITANVSILTHDFVHQQHVDTKIGKNCFIGMNSIVMPGVKIGDNNIVGAGSIVTKDTPSNCIVAGNPAKIIKKNIQVERYGILTV